KQSFAVLVDSSRRESRVRGLRDPDDVAFEIKRLAPHVDEGIDSSSDRDHDRADTCCACCPDHRASDVGTGIECAIRQVKESATAFVSAFADGGTNGVAGFLKAPFHLIGGGGGFSLNVRERDICVTTDIVKSLLSSSVRTVERIAIRVV